MLVEGVLQKAKHTIHRSSSHIGCVTLTLTVAVEAIMETKGFSAIYFK